MSANLQELWDQPYRPNGGFTYDGDHIVRISNREFKYPEDGKPLFILTYEIVAGQPYQGETASRVYKYESEYGIKAIKELLYDMDQELAKPGVFANVDEAVTFLFGALENAVIKINQKTNGKYLNYLVKELIDVNYFNQFKNQYFANRNQPVPQPVAKQAPLPAPQVQSVPPQSYQQAPPTQPMQQVGQSPF